MKTLEVRQDADDCKALNQDSPDLIDMCTILAREVVNLGRYIMSDVPYATPVPHHVTVN